MSTIQEQTVDESPRSEQRPVPSGGRPASPSHVRPIRPQVEAVGLTHVGLVREANEDMYLVRPDLGLFVVTDGMGGAAAGDVAARMAIDAVQEAIERASALHPAHGAPLLLLGGVETANAVIHAAAQGDPRKEGMGTTFTGVLVFAGRIALAHVGDSRCYRLRGRTFDPMSEDHSWVRAMVQRGAMTPEEAATSAMRNKLLRAVGPDEHVDVDTRLAATEPGDVYLLCTDGLHSLVGDEVIASVLRAEPDLTRAARALIELALDAGGDDNVTAVLVRIGGLTANDVDPDLIGSVAEKARVVFMSAQALACAAERALASIVGKDGNTPEGDAVGNLKTAAGVVAVASAHAEDAAREAVEGVDRMLDALGPDARARIVARGSR